MDNNVFKINDNSGSFQNNSSSLFQWVKSISIYTWILILILLSLLGFNIFMYLDKIRQYFKHGLGYLSNVSKEKDASSESETNKKEEPAEDEFESKEKKISDDHKEVKERQDMNNNPLHIALNDNATRQTINKEKVNDGDYQADDSRSFVNGKNDGWCFIGENNGTRVCGEVGLNDECMSGKIFPSREICVNPKLRV
jgi:hypothetical protein